jgi:uncharacterized membrane protein
MNKPGIFLITAVLSFMPISELRGAIPYAVASGIPWYVAYPFSVFFNVLVAPICWIFLATVHKLLYGAENTGKGLQWYRSIFDRFVDRARRKLSAGLEKWGWLAIAVFVAIPLPVTGAWTGTLGAWILGVSKRKTIMAVTLGVIAAGAIVSAVVIFGIEAFRIFVKTV